MVKVKWSCYRPGVAQRVGRRIAILFHGRGTRKGWVVSSTPWPHFTPGEDPVPILQEAGWAPGPVWTGGKTRPHRVSIPDRPARSSVAIPTELPSPLINLRLGIIQEMKPTKSITTEQFCCINFIRECSTNNQFLWNSINTFKTCHVLWTPSWRLTKNLSTYF